MYGGKEKEAVPVEQSDVFDSVQRDAHGYLQLTGGEVDIGHHLRARVLHLQTRVQLQEVETWPSCRLVQLTVLSFIIFRPRIMGEEIIICVAFFTNSAKSPLYYPI